MRRFIHQLGVVARVVYRSIARAEDGLQRTADRTLLTSPIVVDAGVVTRLMPCA